MQVRPGGRARAAHSPDDLSGRDGLPDLNGPGLQTIILAFQPAAVVQDDVIALFGSYSASVTVPPARASTFVPSSAARSTPGCSALYWAVISGRLPVGTMALTGR